MRRKRVQPRFYLFLCVLIFVITLVIYLSLRDDTKVETISMSSIAHSRTVDSVIIRDESLVTASGVSRIEYIAQENSLVSKDDTIVYIYSTGYSQTELNKLETVRRSIQEYHKTLLANIIDSELEKRDIAVDQRVRQLMGLLGGTRRASVITQTRLLESAMVQRQDYMRANMRSDMKLNNLYSQEGARLTSISSWRKEYKAERDGVVSFYTDGYEGTLNYSNLGNITVNDVSDAIEGIGAGLSSVKDTALYRLINQDIWYVSIITSSREWSPVVDQEYVFTFEGFDDLAYSAKVISVSQSGGKTLAVFSIEQPMGPLVYQRALRAQVSITLTGMAVSTDAVYEQNGQTGVLLYDVPGGTFVPVTVLATDGDTALIESTVEGALQMGYTILVK